MRRTYGMQLTIDKYTQMVARLDVRDLDLANAFAKARASMTGELGHDGSERFDIVGSDDDVAEAPSLAAA